MQLYFRPQDYLTMIKPAGPLFAFIVPWVLVLIGYSFPLCEIIVSKYSLFFPVVIGNIVTMLLLAFVLQTFYPQKITDKIGAELEISPRFKRIVWGLLSFYLICQIFQVAYFKGFPLFWLVTNSSKTYFDYGINSLNGLLNAVFLIASTGFFLMYLKEPSKKKLLLLFCLFMLPILLVSRQLLISLSLQIACCSIIYSPKSIKKIFFAGIILMGLFIIVGNFRTGMDILVQILKPKDFVPTILYPLLWIYAYVVTPFNNINANIDVIQPIGVPFYEMSSLVPSVFRGFLGFEDGDTGFELVHQNMTVSTFYFEPLLDFGAAYAFIFMLIFQVLFLLAYRRAQRTHAVAHVVEYSVFYMISILSIFSNLLLYLPVIAQLVILNLAKIKIFKRKNILILSAGSKI